MVHHGHHPRQDVAGPEELATDWHQLVGAQSVEGNNTFPLEDVRDTDRDRLKIPLVMVKDSNVMYLDIQEGAEFGAGPHGMLIGTTSWKSESTH